LATKTATVTLDGEGLRLAGRTGSGHTLTLDSDSGNAGARPSELIPLALAGCTAMDVISILRKKRQAVRRYEVEAAGIQQDEHPNAFLRIDLVHVVEGSNIDVEAVRRAIELSATKYCSVGATLSSGMTEVHHSYRVRDDAVDGDLTAEVIVLGPQAEAGVASLAVAG
jgi:putative redox protein